MPSKSICINIWLEHFVRRQIDFSHHRDAVFLGTAPFRCGKSDAAKSSKVLLNSAIALPTLDEEMLNEKLFQDFSARLSELIASSPARDLEKNARALLSGFFSRLDLVTREEFDVQTEVLRRTREKLEQLEARVAELETERAAQPKS